MEENINDEKSVTSILVGVAKDPLLVGVTVTSFLEGAEAKDPLLLGLKAAGCVVPATKEPGIATGPTGRARGLEFTVTINLTVETIALTFV